MSFQIADTVRLDSSQRRLIIDRSFKWPPVDRPRFYQFFLPNSALLSECSHHITRRERSGHFRRWELDTEQPEHPDPPHSEPIAQLTYFLAVEADRETWKLRGQSLMPNVDDYSLELQFGSDIAGHTWKPGPFLQSGTLSDPPTGLRLNLAHDPHAPLVVDYKAEFAFSEAIYTTDDIRAMLREMPSLFTQADKQDGILDGVAAIVLLHFLNDLCPFMLALEMRGLNPSQVLLLHKDYPYANFDLVAATLRNRGYTVTGPVRNATDPQLLTELEHFCQRTERPIVVIEDGGYVLPAFHRNETLRLYLPRVLGMVEQTTYGARRAEEVLLDIRKSGTENRLGTALLSVASSEVKTVYEPRFVAEAACDNVKRLLPTTSWQGAGVVVVGYGAIGRSLAEFLSANKAAVGVCDRSPLRLVLAKSEGPYVVAQTLEEIIARFRDLHQTIHFIFGTTGTKSVTADLAESLAPFRPQLVSVSSKQAEFDLPGFAKKATRKQDWCVGKEKIGTTYVFANGGELHVLAYGYPVNFFGGESVANRHIDPIMALLHACAAELAAPRVLADPNLLPEGEGDERYPALPRSRLSSRIVDKIAEAAGVFEPMLQTLARD